LKTAFGRLRAEREFLNRMSADNSVSTQGGMIFAILEQQQLVLLMSSAL
jgi:hypothetical protein